MNINWNKVAKWSRLVVLVGLLIWITYEAYIHQVLGGGKAPSIHALCPYGALESLYTLLFTGSFIKKIYSGTVVLLGLTVILAILFRRSFCGLLCPFGALQELFGMLRQKLFKRRFIIPPKVDRPARYLKYAILLLTLVMAWYYGALWMAPYDPYSAYSHLTSIAGAIEKDPFEIIGFALLFITLIGSFLYDRFFCKYLCPVGAFYAIIGKVSPTKIERDDNLCVHCKKCNKACPVNIDVEQSVKITDPECINCNECVLACPEKGALEVKTAKKTVHPLIILALVVALFFGTIVIAQLTCNDEAKANAGGSESESTVTQISENPVSLEKIDVSGIKGSMTIREAMDTLKMDSTAFYVLFKIPESVPPQTLLKDISTVSPGYDFQQIKGSLE